MTEKPVHHPNIDLGAMLEAANQIPDGQLLPAVQAADRIMSDFNRQLVTDRKTGLLNHDGFVQAIHEVAQLPEVMDGSAVAQVFIADLNHFRTLNQGLGHPAGDEALRIVAEVLDEHGRRDQDVIAHGTRGARLGGDEFGIVSVSRVSTDGQRQIDTPKKDPTLDDPWSYTDPVFKDSINNRIADRLRGTRFEEYDLSLSLGRARIDPESPPELALAEADACSFIDKYGPRVKRVEQRIAQTIEPDDTKEFFRDLVTFDKFEERRPEYLLRAADQFGIPVPPPNELLRQFGFNDI